MYLAKNHQGEIVESFRLSQKNQQESFWCVKCGKKMKLRASKKGRWHFVHVGKKKTTGEGREHKAGKDFFLQWGKAQGHEILVEEIFVKENRRGDLFLPQERKILEFQCSKMTATEISQRQKDYEEGHFQLQWILGQAYKEKKHFTQQQKNFFNYHPKLGFYYFYLKENLYLVHHWKTHQGKSAFLKEHIRDNQDFLKLWEPENLKAIKKSAGLTFNDFSFSLQRLAVRKDLRFLKEQEAFYLAKKNILSLSPDFYQLVSLTLPFMKGLGLAFQRELLEKLRGKNLMWVEFPAYFAEFLNQTTWFHPLPLVSEKDCSRSYWQTYGSFFLKKRWCHLTIKGVEFSENLPIF